MKILVILVFSFLYSYSLSAINLPKTSVCDSTLDYDFIDVEIINHITKIDGSVINNYNEISDIVIKTREKLGESDRNRLAIKLIADRNSRFSLIDSILTEFRKASVLQLSIKTNNLDDNCYINLRLPPCLIYDSLNRPLFPERKHLRKRIGIFYIEYYNTDSVIANSKIVSNQDLKKELLRIINKGKFSFCSIKPNNNSIGEIIELIDLYIATLNISRQEFLQQKGKLITELNDFELYEFETKFQQKIGINYITCKVK